MSHLIIRRHPRSLLQYHPRDNAVQRVVEAATGYMLDIKDVSDNEDGEEETIEPNLDNAGLLKRIETFRYD